METRNGLRIGHMTRAVLTFALLNPGLHVVYAARYVAPERHGRVGLGNGYQSVKRAIRAGLVRTTRDPHHAGRSLLWPAGMHAC